MGYTYDNRKRLIRMAQGATQYYCIEYSVDIKGNITIWGGEPLAPHMMHDLFCRRVTEDYLHLYDNWRHGGELVRMEQEAAERITRAELIAAYIAFRKQHPNDGYGMLHAIAQRWCGADKDDMQAERADVEDVRRTLRERNRRYIAELYGETLPIDYDFKAAYNLNM